MPFSSSTIAAGTIGVFILFSASFLPPSPPNQATVPWAKMEQERWNLVDVSGQILWHMTNEPVAPLIPQAKYL